MTHMKRNARAVFARAIAEVDLDARP